VTKLLAVLGTIANLIANFNPLNDWLYPKLLDRFGHATARRVCSAIAILAMLTIVPPIALGLWVYNCVLDFALNVVWGWVFSVRDHLSGLLHGEIDGLDSTDDDA
jgi:hypothetical protein